MSDRCCPFAWMQDSILCRKAVCERSNILWSIAATSCLIALSCWTIHIWYGWNVKSFFKIVRTDSRLNRNSRACLRADFSGLRITACLTIAMFSGVLAVILGPRWLFLYGHSCCLQLVNPPKNCIAAGNSTMSSKVEMNSEKSLRRRDRSIMNICIIRKHAVLYRPLLHSDWNGIQWRG